MIKITDDYFVDADEYCYILKKDVHRIDKDGKKRYVNLGYYSTLPSAVNGLREYLIRAKVKKTDMDLAQVLTLCESVEQQLNKYKESSC